MSNTTPDSVRFLLSSSSPVCTAARAVIVEDDALRAFAGSSSALATAVRDCVTGTEDPPVAVAPQATVNLTAKWLDANGRTVYAALVQALDSKMKRSRELGVVEDHVQSFLTRLVEKDTLAPFIAKGSKIQMSVLRIWAYQSACTELRRWGVDASLRASRNAKTSREVQQGDAFRPVQAHTPAVEVRSYGDHPSAHDRGDLCNPTEATPEDIVSQKSRVDHVRASLVRLGHPHLVPVVDGLLEGRSVAELNAMYGVSLDQIRGVLRAIPSC